MDTRTIVFERFEFSPRQRRLVRNGEPIRIGSRAFDILATLIDNAGSIVTKEQLIVAVWPHTFVDETNLRVHISALRRALDRASPGTPTIENIPGRGYCFVAAIQQPGDALPAAADPASTDAARTVEREEVIPC